LYSPWSENSKYSKASIVSASGMTNDTALGSVDSESTDFKFVPSSASGLEPDSSESRSHTVVNPVALNIECGRILQCKEWAANGKSTLFLSVLLEGDN